MKKIITILLIISATLLTACETILPPDWRSMDAFKKSLNRSSGPKEEAILISNTALKPSFNLLSNAKVIKGSVSIVNDAKIDISKKISYKYHYIQRSTSQYTPDYERYYRTSTPKIDWVPDFLEFKLVINNELQHSINSADFSAAIFINNNRVQTNILNSKKVLPNTNESIVIRGPVFSELKSNDKVTLRLYDVTTGTNQAGAPSRKDTFTWDMTYKPTDETLDKPLYVNKEYVLVYYRDAQKAKLGYYTHDIKGRNEKRWDPQTNQWYTSKQWKSLRRNESLVNPERDSNIKIGE